MAEQSKTEREARESLARKGYWVGHGKRAFQVAKRLQGQQAFPGASYVFDAFNGNGHRSQWNSPRFVPAYEVAIRLPADSAKGGQS